jgi:hypothetical protein
MVGQELRPLTTGEVRFRLHGRQEDGSERVPASVFAQKLAVLVRALRAADAAVNGRVTHDYVISNLEVGSALVEMREEPIKTAELLPSRSSVSAFEDCVEAIREGQVQRAQLFGKCPRYVSQLAKGSRNRFGYAELWLEHEEPVRVDEFLLEQSLAVGEGDPRIFRGSANTSGAGEQRWYRGTAHATFEGVVKGVDLRGALPEVKLILAAGGKEIDCVFRGVEIERIREALDRRVRVEGTAFYDGRSGLPRRLEVTRIELTKEVGDFTRWRGTFEPFTTPEWESDFDNE